MTRQAEPPGAGRASASALIVADPPRPGACLRGLEPLIGPEGCASVQAVLVRRAAAWAAEAAPGRAFVAVAGAAGRPRAGHTAETRADSSVARPVSPDVEVVAPPVSPDVEVVTRLVASEGEVFAQPGGDRSERLVGAIGAVFARTGRGPLLVAGTAVPRLAPGHAAAALTDIAEGCDATFGPALDGGFYLAGLAGPQSGIFALPDEVWAGADLLGMVIGRAHAHGLELGLLRYERELRGPLDVHAMLADPLSPPDVVAALRAAM